MKTNQRRSSSRGHRAGAGAGAGADVVMAVRTSIDTSVDVPAEPMSEPVCDTNPEPAATTSAAIVDAMVTAMDPAERATFAARGWVAVHAAATAATDAMRTGGVTDDAYARAIRAAIAAGDAVCAANPDTSKTRWTGDRIGTFQRDLYRFNRHIGARFPDVVLLALWAAECGSATSGRGPARARFDDRGCVSRYIGGTRHAINVGAHQSCNRAFLGSAFVGYTDWACAGRLERP